MNAALYAHVFPWQQSLWTRFSALIKHNNLPHALLFSGLEGIGKRHFANVMMQAVCCEFNQPDGTACEKCRNCLLIRAGSHPDYRVIEPEKNAQSIRVDAIRDVIEFANQSALISKYRVILIDPAPAMNASAANALLKILEEPPPFTLFILIGHSRRALPPTVISRCQRISFPIPTAHQAADWLTEQCGSPEANRLLDVVEGAPLKALAWFKEGLCALQDDFYQDWTRVLAHQMKVCDMANKWSSKQILEKLTLKTVLDWLFFWVRDGIRAECIKGVGVQQKLLNFYVKIQKSYQSISLVPQLNSQLVLEDVMLTWCGESQ